VTAIGAALPRVPHRELVAHGRELDALVVSPVGDDPLAQLQRFAAEVLPLLASG
jgi:hypothetical protein